MKINRRDFVKKTIATAALASPFILTSKSHAASSLKVWKFGGTGRETEYWPVANKVFSQKNPSINLNYQYYYGQIRRNKIMAGFQTKKLADIIIAFGQDIPEFEGFGMIQPISGIDKSAISSLKNKIVPEIWETGMHNNELFGIPTYVDMMSFITYDKKAFDEAGIKEPPRNWDELREIAKKLTKPGRPGIAFPATTTVLDGTIWEGIAYSNGGRIFDENTKKVTLNDKGCVDALQLYVDLIKDGSTPDPGVMLESKFAGIANQFLGGNYAMVVLPSFSFVPWGFDRKEEFSDFLFPRPSSATGSFKPVATLMDPTACLMVNSRSKNYEEIMAYLKFWTQDEQLKFWGTKELARVPASKKAWESSEMKQLWPSRVDAYNDGTLFNGSTPAPRFIGVSQIEQYMRVAIQKAVGGKMSASDALNEANESAQKQIDVLLGG